MTNDRAVSDVELTDEQCSEFRRMPGSFNDMVRAIYKAGYQRAQESQAVPAVSSEHALVCARNYRRFLSIFIGQKFDNDIADVNRGTFGMALDHLEEAAGIILSIAAPQAEESPTVEYDPDPHPEDWLDPERDTH